MTADPRRLDSELDVFADEAGNTGTNFLDDNQRWYVLAGIAIERRKVDHARAAVEEFRQETGAGELKGAALLGRPSGRERVAGLFRLVGRSGGVPFFAILEKRFNLAGRFDHIVSDPEANDRVTLQEFQDNEARRRAASSLAQLSPETLSEMQNALRGARGYDWMGLNDRCVGELRTLGLSSPADQLLGAREARFEDLFGPGVEVDPKEMSVNEAAFTLLLQAIDSAAASAGVRRIRVVHDETASFEATYRAVYERLSARGVATPVYDVAGNKIWPLLAVQDLAFAVSHDEPLVQAADVMAATLAWFCSMKSPSDFRREPWMKGLAELVTAMIVSVEPRMVFPVVGDADLEHLSRTLWALRNGTGADG